MMKSIPSLALAVLISAPVSVSADYSDRIPAAERAKQACDLLIIAELGDEVRTRLKRAEPRGSSFEIWINVAAADQEHKAFCVTRRGKIEEFILSEGRWTGSFPKRPAQ